ncbi:MAG: hypothetical protein ACOC1P_01910 [Minisyncoccales bacterium]
MNQYLNFKKLTLFLILLLSITFLSGCLNNENKIKTFTVQRCILPTDLTCLKPIITQNKLSITIQNNREMIIKNLQLISDKCNIQSKATDILPEEKNTFTLSECNFDINPDSFKYNLLLNYTIESGDEGISTKQGKGTVSGIIK